MASDYLKLTQKTSEQGSVLFRQSLLWQAVVENARGNKNESQKVLTRLISLYPQSEEVTWVNRKRTPAAAPVQAVHEQAVHEQTKEESHHE
jgi:Tfp pilus assembly protein PilF